MLPVISMRSIVNRDFCELSHAIYEIMLFALKLSGRASLQIDSSHFSVPTKKGPLVGGNKEISPDGNAHDEAVTINK